MVVCNDDESLNRRVLDEFLSCRVVIICETAAWVISLLHSVGGGSDCVTDLFCNIDLLIQNQIKFLS